MDDSYFQTLHRIRDSYIREWRQHESFDPYFFTDWFIFFTPIEENVWADIRFLGLPMLPQFPVGPYFIDFADPNRKIAIEADGKIHRQHQERDKKRDEYLQIRGWKVFRIPGRKTFATREDYFDEVDYESDDWEEEHEEQNQRFQNESSEGILMRIRNLYYPDWPNFRYCHTLYGCDKCREKERKDYEKYGDSLVSSEELKERN